jgi:DNA repair exonuclease SbcCD ATPase subunit
MSACPDHMNRHSPPIQKQTENHLKIARKAEEISRLHSRIKETLRLRAQSDSAHQQWKEACAEFHTRYDLLAFPSGHNEETFFDQLVKSDPVITEWALCFLELRPYFFRSGYVWQKLLRRLKHVALSEEQQQRFSDVIRSYGEWKAQKQRVSDL